ncbi:hypothetical protein [Psychrobacillus sp. NPDC093180]|uniref:hypothetical protein n=1 Tax=Psychrobacillus sp. NPDC093180 TaxID=3364489 RepID=UPI00380CC0EE
MSLSKRFYESDASSEKVKYAHKFELGQRFIINDHDTKATNGHWEVTSESNLEGNYYCNRVLKNGNLSMSATRSNFRVFTANEIHKALEYIR